MTLSLENPDQRKLIDHLVNGTLSKENALQIPGVVVEGENPLKLRYQQVEEIVPELSIPITDCGAKLFPVTEGDNSVLLAQIEAPAKGQLCGGCRFKLNPKTGEYEMTNTGHAARNRNCVEGLAPIARKK